MGEFPQLRDIHLPPDPYQWWLTPYVPISRELALTLALFTIFLALATILFFLFRKKKPAPVVSPVLPAAAEQELESELHRLRTECWHLGPGQLGAHVSEAIRIYLHRREGALARFRTTTELTHTPGAVEAPVLPLFAPFTVVLEQCDTLRYGGSGSSPEQRLLLIDSALSALQKASQSPPPPAA
jgi:hypothetical protein